MNQQIDIAAIRARYEKCISCDSNNCDCEPVAPLLACRQACLDMRVIFKALEAETKRADEAEATVAQLITVNNDNILLGDLAEKIHYENEELIKERDHWKSLFDSEAHGDLGKSRQYWMDETETWKDRAEALERALRAYNGRVHPVCFCCLHISKRMNTENECKDCGEHTKNWQFDQARFFEKNGGAE